MPKTYLGDAVYVDWDGAYIVLTTENGVYATNTIYLEPDVYSALARYVERLGQKQEAHDTRCLCDACASTPGTYAYKIIHEEDPS